MTVWMTPKEVREYLKVSRTTFYRMIHDGRLIPYQLAGTAEKRFKLEDVEALLTPVSRDGEVHTPADEERSVTS
ncbi:MAG: hypothetical protein CW346_20605 [Bacillaceae bacterium]|nr:hypothetical protein [Bacillaceae bacterium]